MKNTVIAFTACMVLSMSCATTAYCKKMCPITVWEGTRETTQWVPCDGSDVKRDRRRDAPTDEDFGGMPDGPYSGGEVDPNEWPSENE